MMVKQCPFCHINLVMHKISSAFISYKCENKNRKQIFDWSEFWIDYSPDNELVGTIYRFDNFNCSFMAKTNRFFVRDLKTDKIFGEINFDINKIVDLSYVYQMKNRIMNMQAFI